MKKYRIAALAVAAALLIALCGCSKTESKVTAVITVKDYGSMTFELYPDKAPATVANFVKLAESGFYDGLTFHRIVKDFVAQGGDPTGTGKGGSDETIKGEFSANGFTKNTLSHVKGAISMARTLDSMDSATSQFFICTADCTSLDGSYAVFGMMTDGWDVLDALNALGTTSGTPTKTAYIESITIEK